VVKSPCSMAGMHFRKFIACKLKQTPKIQMPHYWDKISVQIGPKSPTNPLVSPGGVVGLNVDRCITIVNILYDCYI